MSEYTNCACRFDASDNWIKRCSVHAALEAERDALKAALESYQEIARNSQGVSGWHQNGDVASWEELGIKR